MPVPIKWTVKYYVYPGKSTSTVQPGVYDTVKEVDEALGR